MTFIGRPGGTALADRVLERLVTLAGASAPARYLVAFSGGLDSSVLLHVLATTRGRHATPLLAVHVNHGMQAAADRWEAHCRRVAGELEVDFAVERIEVPRRDPRGREGAARELRYRAIARRVRAGDHVLTAHHQDDQAETLLLNLLRGSGVQGLAGIGAAQPLGEGLLLRPLLDVSREELANHAALHALRWCDDPSNADASFDRNFLRNEILPALGRRWPSAAASLARSAALLAEAAELAADLAALDLVALGGNPARLELAPLRELGLVRQRNLLRFAIRRLGLPAPPAARLEQVVRELLPAGADAQPLVRWGGAEVRHYRDRVYIRKPAQQSAEPDHGLLSAERRELAIGPGLGRLKLAEEASGGIAPALAAAGLRIEFRKGGERLRPAGRHHTHALKKLFQEHAVVPWMRACVPLLYAGERLVAVGDLWIADCAWSEPGFAVRWLDRPELH